MKTNLRTLTAQCRAHAAQAHSEAIAAHCEALQQTVTRNYEPVCVCGQPARWHGNKGSLRIFACVICAADYRTLLQL